MSMGRDWEAPGTRRWRSALHRTVRVAGCRAQVTHHKPSLFPRAEGPCDIHQGPTCSSLTSQSCCGNTICLGSTGGWTWK